VIIANAREFTATLSGKHKRRIRQLRHEGSNPRHNQGSPLGGLQGYTREVDPMTNERTIQEAWNMAQENKGLMYRALGRFVYKYSLPWYSREELQVELESYAWEAMFKACLKWDESKGKLSTYAIKSVNNMLYDKYNLLKNMGITHVNRDNAVWMDDLDAESKDYEDEDTDQDIRDYTPQPWQSKDKSVEELILESNLGNEIENILGQMSEPHASILRLAYDLGRDETPFSFRVESSSISGGDALTRNPNGRGRKGKYLSVGEIGEQLGLATWKTKILLHEAENVLRDQLKEAGWIDKTN
jgi:RNA polymerase sigma factor (sigma-70 family)